MRLPRLFSSGAFRFGILFALLFGLGAGALLVVVEHSIDGYAADTVEDRVASEIDILRGEEAELGRIELIRAVDRHGRAVRERDLRYLLLDPRGARLAGALPRSAARVGLHRLELTERPDDGGGVTPLLADGVRLPDGSVLVVAADTSDLGDLRRRLILFTASFGTVICLMVLVGGSVIGSIFLRRLDLVNGAIARIVAGRFAERLPSIGMGAEFDQLSANLNGMLDQIEGLMDGLRQVSTDVAHDLRTPLTRLRQRLERLQESDPPRTVRDQVDGALVQTDEILAIFAALLRIGALESGAARALFSPVDLSDLAGRIGAAYLPEIVDGRRNLAVDVEPGIIVSGDRDLLAQAVSNLFGNAIAHTEPGTTIRLSVASLDGTVRLIIEDDGPGIPPHERERVLRRFYRLDRSRSTPGAGLGLPLVAAIVTLHGGTLALGAAEPGLRVAVSLPGNGNADAGSKPR